MEIERKIKIDAPPPTVWQVIKDVERWPEWTRSIDKVTLLDRAELAPGGRARVKQPKLRAVNWTVSDFSPGHGFAWRTSGFGYEAKGYHYVEADGAGSLATLRLEQSGPVMRLIPGLKSISQRYVEMEAQGLKQRSEEFARASQDFPPKATGVSV